MEDSYSSHLLNYIYSSSLDTTKIQIKIGSLDGLKYKHDYNRLLQDEMIGYSGLFQDRKAADLMVVAQVYSGGHPLTVPMTTKYKSFTNNWSWNEWITLPLTISDLPRDALLAFTVFDCAGATKMKTVGGTTVTLFGKYGELRQGLLDLYVWPNVAADAHRNTTPGLLKSSKNKIQSMYKLVKKYRQNAIPRTDWLDRLSFREMELYCDAKKKSSDEIYLSIDLPEICLCGKPISVIYYEEESIYQTNVDKDINFIDDPETLFDDNLVEDKHHKLSRGIRSKAPDKDAKPNSESRDKLVQIVAYPPTKSLTAEEQDLLWKYRFYLSDKKKALVKFLKCVNWNLGLEVHQALDMMFKWAPIDADDALQLLSPAFLHPVVRRYAVDCLSRASDEKLSLYLLQLVQALRYEDTDSVINVFNEMQLFIANEGPNVVHLDFLNRLLLNCNSSCTYLLLLLISRACKNFKIANNFFWYLTVECDDSNYFTTGSDTICVMYLKILTLFMQTLRYGDVESQKRYEALQDQQTLMKCLVELIENVANETGNRTKKISKLQQLLSDNAAFKLQFASFDPIPFPLDPDVLVKRVDPGKAWIYKSKLMPLRLTFVTSDDTEYVAIFKYGDDLRQDQLVLQVIALIDDLLLSENLDLKLTPYKVLATSAKHGFVQYVHSRSIADILSKEGSIQAFFRKYHQKKDGPYGISKEITDTYIKSCAGYSVITYLLGIGDRHLDNLMITPDGNLFHIDFGYILGRDPKPLPPPMKLSKEMVEAMGGLNSSYYNEFKKQCFTAFIILRRHTDLILNLFSLMSDANIPDIALEPDKVVKKIEDKLCLHMGDEEAIRHFQSLLESSAADVMAAVVDQLHKLTQYYRN